MEIEKNYFLYNKNMEIKKNNFNWSKVLGSCWPGNGSSCGRYSHRLECNFTACALVTTFRPSPSHLLMGLVCMYYYGSHMVPGYNSAAYETRW